MFRVFRRFLVPLLSFILVVTNLNMVQAARGIPGSPDFGIGATIYPDGANFEKGLEMAADLSLDWIRVPVSWNDYQPDPSKSPQFDALMPVMLLAAQNDIAVLVSLTGVPAWALTPSGPDAALTAQFVTAIVQRYPNVVQAVELLPGANTRAGWGADPNPLAYASVYQAVDSQLKFINAPVLVAAAGLRPIYGEPVNGDLDDEKFLAALYAQGASQWMSVLSIQYNALTGLPTTFPENESVQVLRHYERIRQIMVANGHQTGLIWITQFSPPSGTIGLSDSVINHLNAQANWMSLAYTQLRAQLYIGVAMGQSLNPGPGGTDAGTLSLISAIGEYHPFYTVLRDMVSLNKIGSVSIMPGKPKGGNLEKKRP